MTCFSGWQEFSIVPVSQIHPVDTQAALAHHVAALGHNGLAAYFGTSKIGNPKAGETVLVSAAVCTSTSTTSVVRSLTRSFP